MIYVQSGVVDRVISSSHNDPVAILINTGVYRLLKRSNWAVGTSSLAVISAVVDENVILRLSRGGGHASRNDKSKDREKSSA
ncbi:hypothetical protein [Salinibacter ruber]|uniref:hypothetical protein n=1 Tax=Salinibacter ruber TaxID=146919 RepID=UPI001610E46E|nr:hypothetical protein [Salinibacter ruber]MBB4089904.1 hypothetical protein [Salinibacter ruber]